MPFRVGLPSHVADEFAAQLSEAGWTVAAPIQSQPSCSPIRSEQSATKMVETYAHAVDERRLDEIDRAFAGRDAERDVNPPPAARSGTAADA